jgi:hypothetical protein
MRFGESQRTIFRRLARMGFAAAVVASSAAIGFVASKVWPLPRAGAGVLDFNLLSATVSPPVQPERLASPGAPPEAVQTGATPQASHKEAAATLPAGPVEPKPKAPPVAAVSPEAPPSLAAAVDNKVAAAPAREAAAESDDDDTAADRRAARSADGKRQRKGRWAQSAARNRSRPTAVAQSQAPSPGGNFQHDYTLRDFMAGSAPRY